MSQPPDPRNEPSSKPFSIHDLKDDALEVCNCGHDRYHPMVSPHLEYSAWGSFWITVMGVSAVPLRARFRCRRCKQTFDFSDDPVELKKFM